MACSFHRQLDQCTVLVIVSDYDYFAKALVSPAYFFDLSNSLDRHVLLKFDEQQNFTLF